MKSKLILTSLLTIICLSLAACGSLEPDSPSNVTLLVTPKVTGIQLTDDTGTEIGIWGQPKSNLALFPNPTPTNMSIVLQLGKDTSGFVAIWALNALGPFEEENNFSYGGGANVYIAGPSPAINLFEGILLDGSHTIFLDLADLPGGFYTVYLSIGGNLQAADIFIARNFEDIPYYLKELMGSP